MPDDPGLISKIYNVASSTGKKGLDGLMSIFTNKAEDGLLNQITDKIKDQSPWGIALGLIGVVMGWCVPKEYKYKIVLSLALLGAGVFAGNRLSAHFNDKAPGGDTQANVQKVDLNLGIKPEDKKTTYVIPALSPPEPGA